MNDEMSHRNRHPFKITETVEFFHVSDSAMSLNYLTHFKHFFTDFREFTGNLLLKAKDEGQFLINENEFSTIN